MALTLQHDYQQKLLPKSGNNHNDVYVFKNALISEILECNLFNLI